jgi:hypothetical protein
MSEPSATSKSAWKKANSHTITLPSSKVVTIKLPNLPEMIKGGSFPNALIPIAVKRIQEEEITADKIKELADYHRFLIHKMLLSPTVEEEDVPDLPPADIDMLISIANRERDMDAVGHHLSGLETVDSFKRFRGIDSSSEDLLG